MCGFSGWLGARNRVGISITPEEIAGTLELWGDSTKRTAIYLRFGNKGLLRVKLWGPTGGTPTSRPVLSLRDSPSRSCCSSLIAVLLYINYSFWTHRYRMPKPLKTPPVSTPDRTGVFGQMGKALRVGLYARVSTHDQQTLPLQLSVMRDYAKKRSWAVAVEVKDVGSGATTRPQREKLIEAARRREIDLVLTSMAEATMWVPWTGPPRVGQLHGMDCLLLTKPRVYTKSPHGQGKSQLMERSRSGAFLSLMDSGRSPQKTGRGCSGVVKSQRRNG